MNDRPHISPAFLFSGCLAVLAGCIVGLLVTVLFVALVRFW